MTLRPIISPPPPFFADRVPFYLSVIKRRLEREEGARRLAEEKVATLQETAKTCSNEVSHLRKRRRELEAKNAELRYMYDKSTAVSGSSVAIFPVLLCGCWFL